MVYIDGEKKSPTTATIFESERRPSIPEALSRGGIADDSNVARIYMLDESP